MCHKTFLSVFSHALLFFFHFIGRATHFFVHYFQSIDHEQCAQKMERDLSLFLANKKTLKKLFKNQHFSLQTTKKIRMSMISDRKLLQLPGF